MSEGTRLAAEADARRHDSQGLVGMLLAVSIHPWRVGAAAQVLEITRMTEAPSTLKPDPLTEVVRL